jgi:hypothetical protein
MLSVLTMAASPNWIQFVDHTGWREAAKVLALTIAGTGTCVIPVDKELFAKLLTAAIEELPRELEYSEVCDDGTERDGVKR